MNEVTSRLVVRRVVVVESDHECVVANGELVEVLTIAMAWTLTGVGKV
jgi:hypothetical protein